MQNNTAVGSAGATGTAAGGAVYSVGGLVLSSVTVQNNVGQRSAGTAGTKQKPNGGAGQDADDGGIWSSGSLTLENTLVQNNQAIGGAGGAAYLKQNSTYGGNGGTGPGGGLFVAGGTVNLTRVTKSGNTGSGVTGGPQAADRRPNRQQHPTSGRDCGSAGR